MGGSEAKRPSHANGGRGVRRPSHWRSADFLKGVYKEEQIFRGSFSAAEIPAGGEGPGEMFLAIGVAKKLCEGRMEGREMLMGMPERRSPRAPIKLESFKKHLKKRPRDQLLRL